MFFVFFGLWVILNGRWTTEIGVFGLVFAAIMYAFTWKFLGYSPRVGMALIRRLPDALRYGALLLSEIVKANLNVMRMILNKDFEPQPQLVHFDVDLERSRHLVTLANSITLTPGTITVNLEDNHFTVHCLDASLVDGLDDGAMVQALEAMERAADEPDPDRTPTDDAPEAPEAAEDPVVEPEAAAQEFVPEAIAAEESASEDIVSEESASDEIPDWVLDDGAQAESDGTMPEDGREANEHEH